MNKAIVAVLFLGFAIAGLFSQGAAESFSAETPWEGRDGSGKLIASGVVRTKVTIVKVETAKIVAHIRKDMTPFGALIDFEVSAIYRNGRYEFHCEDNWRNKDLGYLIEKQGQYSLFLECIEFSDEGKNLARLYGDEVILMRDK